MSKKTRYSLPPDTNFFERSYGDEFPDDQYYLTRFYQVASKLETRDYFDHQLLSYFFNNGFELLNKHSMERRTHRHTFNQMTIINEEKQLIIVVDLGNETTDNLMTIKFLYNIDNGSIQTQLDFEVINEYIRRKKKANINLVTNDHGHLDTEDYDIVIPEIDLELNYGKEFLKIHEKILTRLNTDKDKGIVLLHGDPGTGKTSYLKYLTKLIDKKDILFIPPTMAELLSEPSIIPFLMDKRNSILVIEDAEKVISDRGMNMGSSTGVSNLLNLTDGILGDCLNIQVIATFNMKKEKIDDALLRKGRLIAEHKFEKLSVENTNRLLQHLNKQHTSTVELSLADIYNIDEDDLRITKNSTKIGFRS